MAYTDFTENIDKLYALDKERRKHLSEMLGIVINGQRDLDMNHDASDTEQLRHVVNNDTFKILVIGEFNAGKSTFINALLGNEVLPTKAIPATAIINQVRYGNPPGAKLHFTDPGKAPIDILIKELSSHVLIKSEGDEQAAREEIRENPLSHAEIWWPLELCRKNNVEIIDSPGLNEDKVRQDVTISYLRKVDTVLFVMLATHFGPSQSEMNTIKSLEDAGHQDLFFVINQWDLLRTRQQEEVRGQALKVLKGLTNRKNDIYFVSALDALEGRMDKNPEQEKKSGFKELEDSLHKFLANERGRIKALRSSREFRRIMRKMLEKSIPEKESLLKMPLGELRDKYALTQKDLDRLEADKSDMVNFVSRQRTQITNLTRTKVKEFFYLIDRDVASWAEDYPIEIQVLSFNLKEQIQEAIEGLSKHLKNKLEEEFGNWEKENLTPFIEDRMESLNRELVIRASDFENNINDVQFTLTGESFEQYGGEDEFGPKNALERILAAAGGWFIGGIGSGAIGALFGWQEMLKSLIPNVAVIFGAILLGLPVIPVAIIAGIILANRSLNNLGAMVKEKVVDKFRQALRERNSDQADKIANQMDEQLAGLKTTLEAGLERKITEIREQAETALAAHTKGESEVALKLEKIEQIKTEVNQVNEELDVFIESLVS